jgi:hypothetical protein
MRAAACTPHPHPARSALLGNRIACPGDHLDQRRVRRGQDDSGAVLHVFLEADAGVLRERLNARVTHPGKDWDQVAREFGMTGVDEMVAAAARQPHGTLMLRSDRLAPAELADEVLAAAGICR